MDQAPDSQGVRRSKYGVLRSTYPKLKTTVVRSWKDWFKAQIKITYDTPIRGEIKLDHPDGKTKIEMEILFIALDREEEVDKLQSLELTAAHINEAKEVHPEIFQMLKSRINRYPHPQDGGATNPFILCDYNSVATEHWLYKLAEEHTPEKHSFYDQPSACLMCDEDEGIVQDTAGNWYRLNPYADNLGHWEFIPQDALIPSEKKRSQCRDITGNFFRIDRELIPSLGLKDLTEVWIPHLDDDYYPDMILGADPAWVNVFVLNNYGQVRSGRPVYPEYYDLIHCAKKPLKPLYGVPIIIGMDLGLNPAAAFFQLSPEGTVMMIDEITSDDCSIEKFCEDYLWPRIRNKYPKHNFHLVIDPTAIMTRSQNDAKAAWQVIKDAKLPFRAAKTNNPASRKNAVIKFLRKVNGFLICPEKCRDARRGFISEYKFEKKRSAQTDAMFKEKPEKNFYSHIHDAIQYACMEILGKRKSYRRKRTPAQHTTPATSAGY